MMMAINISLSLFFVSLALNGINYGQVYMDGHQYFKTVTYYEDVALDYPSRAIELAYVDDLIIDDVRINISSIGYMSREDLLLESENGIQYKGSTKIKDHEAIIFGSQFPNVDIDQLIETEINGDIEVFIVKCIIEEDEHFLNLNYPSIITYKEDLNHIDIITYEVLEINDLNMIDLDHSINYKSRVDDFNMYRMGAIIASFIFTVVFFVVVIITYTTIMKNMINEKIQTFFLIQFLGIDKEKLRRSLLYISFIYGVTAFLLSIALTLAYQYVLFHMLDISLLIDTDIFSNHLNGLAILFIFGCTLISSYIESILMLKTIRKGNLNV